MSELALQLIVENKRTKNPSLDLGKCGLTEIPEELFDCLWLEELSFSNRWWDAQKQKHIESKNKGEDNYLSVIPTNIKKLRNVKTLKVGSDFLRYSRISDISPLAFLGSLEVSLRASTYCYERCVSIDLQFK